jgi:hypothetical protein
MTYSDNVRERYERRRLSSSQRQDLEDFCDWLDEVDSIVKDETGFDLSSLPDQNYRDWFDDGSSAESAADSFIDDWKMNGDIPK